MAELKRLNIRVRPEMHEWLSKQAELRGLTLNALVIFAIETYYQQQEMMPMLSKVIELENNRGRESDGTRD